MKLSITLTRSFLLMLFFLVSLSVHSTQPYTGTMEHPQPTRTSASIVQGSGKTLVSFRIGRIKRALKQYVAFYKHLKKKYANSVVGSTILIAVLALAALLLVLLLITQAGVSGIVLTVAGVIGFFAILFWAIRRIRRNAEY